MNMKKIKIAHLYYDLMNLYGENGNIRFLKKKLEEQDLSVSVHFLSIDDDIDYTNYDIFYIGCGNDENKHVVLDNMLKDKESITEAIKSNKLFLVTGNALDLFGKKITSLDGSERNALSVFNYEINEEEFRIVGEQNYDTKLIKEKIIGFQNRNSVLINDVKANNTLFKVNSGNGNKPNDQEEGIHEYNFYGTYLLGPILVRNPHFTDYLVKEICKNQNVKYKKTDKNDVSYKAYTEYLNNFHIKNDN